MDIEPVSTTVVETKPEVTPEVVAGEDKTYTKLFPFFGVETKEIQDSKVNSAIRDIYEIIKLESNGTIEDILWKIRSYESRIGAPSFGERRFQKLRTYLTLLKQESATRKEREAYERV